MRRGAARWTGVLAALLLAACSGGRFGGGPPAPAPGGPPTAAQATRFLSQASFGATDASISQVRAAGYAEWIDQQLAMPVSATHLAFVDARLADRRLTDPNAALSSTEFFQSFWAQTATGPDQLRQRMKLALSEIFVISLADPSIDVRGAASYYDMLGANAFGNFRTLLEQVSLHPQMGIYLTWLGNQREDAASGRNPDENYAREVMQLMTIGVAELNPDGTLDVNSAGQAVATYDEADIRGLARVFTGYSWYAATPTNNTFAGRGRTSEAQVRAMIPYPAFHSTGAKAFLTANIPASSTSDPAGDLRIALDALANHPNVAPFISKQIIQRLVTSNPSPAYVARISAVFANNGRGVRGDLAAVVRAILLDTEARNPDPGINYGKLREPVARLSGWMRAFGATSQSGFWLVGTTSGNSSLNQSALNAPSVFNFWRPGYSPPNTRVGMAGLVAPEFQAVDEVSVAGYLNTMQGVIDAGIGATPRGGTGRDVRSAYAAEIALAREPDALVDRLNLLLMHGEMSSALRARVLEAVNGVSIGSTNPATVSTALANRVKLAIYMTMASPEYLVQR